MQHRESPTGYLVVLDRGEEVLESLTRFATQTGVRGAALSGIGAVDRLTLGFYDLAGRSYTHQSWDEELKIASLTGNLAVVDGGPYPHVHGVFGRRDFSALAGHVFEAVVSVTLEVMVTVVPEPVVRQGVDFCDLKLIHL